MRYHGQGYEIPVAIDPAEIRSVGVADLEERFNGLHEQLYGFRMPGTAAEIVNLRAVGFGSVPKPELPVGEPGAPTRPDAVVDTHQVWFDGEQHETSISTGRSSSPGCASTAPRSSRSSTRRPSSSPATRPRSTSNFNILITPTS